MASCGEHKKYLCHTFTVGLYTKKQTMEPHRVSSRVEWVNTPRHKRHQQNCRTVFIHL